jgi:hypothetical protein
MPQPILYVAITNHGFGHATRTAAIVATLQQMYPELVTILTTTAPRWLLESYIPGDFIHRPRAFDLGVVQSDSVTMDLPATLEKLRQIRSQQSQIIASEVNFIQQNRVGLVLADVPPLAAPIAHAAGVPCWMASNFGWDFIYRSWGGEFVEIADWIGECYGQCDRLFRLPFHESMSAFANIEATGLTGGSPRLEPADLRALFNLSTPPERTILLTFGGLGLAQIPYENLQKFADWQFLTFDRQAPDLPNLLKITDPHYRPVDFMPLCGRIVSKPGYGTFAEACRVGVPIVTITRDDFAEAAVLLDGIRNFAHHQILSPPDFFQGEWEFLRQTPAPPQHFEPLALDGNETIAQAIIDHFHNVP